MTWAEYYDKFYDWSESTQINRLSSVKDFGPASEVCEIAEAFCDEKIASRLIRKALAAGVKFSSDDVANLEGVVTDELFMEMTQSLGGSMSWELFYDHFYDWNISTRRSNAIAQKQFGPAQEVVDVAIELLDEGSATQFLSNAHAAGVRFSAEEILQLDGSVSGSIITKLAMSASDTLSPEDLDDIAYLMSDAEVEKVAQKHGITIEDEEEDEFWEDPAPQRKRSGIGLFGALLIGLSLFGGKPRSKKKHNGRCDGDCANCPPHYGYRYGRWYYGRHHQYGCQFGGNHGGGGLD